MCFLTRYVPVQRPFCTGTQPPFRGCTAVPPLQKGFCTGGSFANFENEEAQRPMMNPQKRRRAANARLWTFAPSRRHTPQGTSKDSMATPSRGSTGHRHATHESRLSFRDSVVARLARVEGDLLAASTAAGIARNGGKGSHSEVIVSRPSVMAPKSDRWIAEACRVSQPFVSAARKVSGDNVITSRQGKDDLPDEAYPDELVETDSPCCPVAGSPTSFHPSVAVSGRPASKRSFVDRLEAFAKDRTLCASEGA